MLLLNKQKPEIHVCHICGSYLFLPVILLTRLSRILNPQLNKDMLQPVLIFRCLTCKTIPLLLDPFLPLESNIDVVK